MKKLINEIQILFLGTTKFRTIFTIVFFFYPIISYFIWGEFELDYAILILIALNTFFNVIINYKLLKSFSLFATLQNELKPIGEKKKFILDKIATLWNVNKSLSILLMMLLIISLLMIQKNISEFVIIYYVTWMLFVVAGMYDSLLMKVIRSYRTYQEE